jgi:hypothetical protein
MVHYYSRLLTLQKCVVCVHRPAPLPEAENTRTACGRCRSLQSAVLDNSELGVKFLWYTLTQLCTGEYTITVYPSIQYKIPLNDIALWYIY